MKYMIDEPGSSEDFINGKTGGGRPPNSVVKSLKELLRQRNQRPNVGNAGPEKLAEVKKANKELRPALINADSLNKN